MKLYFNLIFLVVACLCMGCSSAVVPEELVVPQIETDAVAVSQELQLQTTIEPPVETTSATAMFSVHNMPVPERRTVDQLKPVKAIVDTTALAMSSAKPTNKTRKPESLTRAYVVKEGETLWTIAARRELYGDALLWSLLYQANRDQIKDPRQIYPEQVLSIPRNHTEKELQAAREWARHSEVFPVKNGSVKSP